MPATILSGTPVAEAILAALRPEADRLKPTLTIVQVGDLPASSAYIRKKIEACQKTGIAATHLQLAESVTLEQMLELTKQLNADEHVTGYLLQLPLPEHLWEHQPQIMKSIDPAKDVDGLTAYNLGKLLISEEFGTLPPATAAGVVALLDHYGITLKGRHAVVVGRSALVGKPLSLLLLHRSATVTVCHSATPDLAEHCRRADILISAAGQPGLITAGMVKPGATVVDVGVTRTDEGLQGDVAADVADVAGALTPVPGGVGPMTVACLLRNCVTAARRRSETAPA